MKKIICIVGIIFVAAFFSACGSGEEQQAEKDSLQIVTTVFPEYDWVNNVLGDNPAGVEVTLLMDSGVDMHSFQPTTEDMMKISQCDMFIYVGGESDEWVGDALKDATNEDMIVVNLLESLGDQAREEEIKDGMEAEEEGHDEEAEGEAHEHEYDEHVWLSPKNAEILCGVIEEAVATMDPANKETYDANLAEYQDQIKAIDRSYSEAVKGASKKTLLFGDRFPFRYLTDEYGLDYYAAFVGCSAETEASFETIRFLANKMDELKLDCVCTIEGSDHKIAETIIQNTKTKDQKILTLDSMQSVTANNIEDGTSWLRIMESNLTVLKEALQ